MRPTLRFGIAGLGLASTFTLPDFLSHPGIAVTAAADLRPAALDHFHRELGGETFASVEDLCSSPDVDAVYICTPPSLHAEHAILAAEQGKHVILEKPMAVSIEECEAINAAVARNGVSLLVGHTHSFDPPIRKLRELTLRGDLGRLQMIHSWNFTDFMYRARVAWEMDTSRGGGVVYAQAPHQVDIVRLLGGGLVKSVRGTTGVWDPQRPSEGSYVAYLEFQDGTPATLVYSGYAHFDSAELHYDLGERGQPRDLATNARTLERYRARKPEPDGQLDETLRNAIRYGGEQQRAAAHAAITHKQPFFGITLASFQLADVRQSPDGLYIYGEHGRSEIDLSGATSAAHGMIDELLESVASGRPPLHDGRWGEATLEVCLAMLKSQRSRAEVTLEHQVPCSD